MMSHHWWLIFGAFSDIILNLSKALDCPDYTFVIPDNYSFAPPGVTRQYSSRCNADFIDIDGDDCNKWEKEGWCNFEASESFVRYGIKNSEGIWETALQCPQCGCGDGGATNLYDLYADSGNRKPTDGLKGN